MIRLSRPEDLPLLKALWMEAFPDSPEATDFYFAKRNRYDNLLLDEQDGHLRGMLSMLPIELVSGGRAYPARYFFAIATDLRFRGQGISTALIREAEEITRRRGEVASLLVPAGEDLFRFYGKRGYETVFSYDLLRLTPDMLPPCPADARLLSVDAAAWTRLRDEAFGQSWLFARWDTEALDYVVQAAAAWEAPMLRFEAPGGEGMAYCEWDGDTLVVKDLALRGLDAHTACAILHRELHAQAYALRLPQGAVPGGATPVPFGMINWLNPFEMQPGSAPYLSLGKD